MSWFIPMMLVAVVATMFIVLVIRNSLVPEARARELLRRGALLVDVRSPDEFRQDSIPGATNIPWNTVRDRFPEFVADRNQPVLVHCLSGGRSAIAQRELKAIGYANIFNLGSLARAREIVRMDDGDL